MLHIPLPEVARATPTDGFAFYQVSDALTDCGEWLMARERLRRQHLLNILPPLTANISETTEYAEHKKAPASYTYGGSVNKRRINGVPLITSKRNFLESHCQVKRT